MAKNWSEFDKFVPIIDKYMPPMGEGETVASQACTAVNKLVYKWYNDGDVYDNTYRLDGWMNDLSSYANWLYKNTVAKFILPGIVDCNDGDDYEDLLFVLCLRVIDEEYLEELNKSPKIGSIYKCEGQFKFVDEYDDYF